MARNIDRLQSPIIEAFRTSTDVVRASLQWNQTWTDVFFSSLPTLLLLLPFFLGAVTFLLGAATFFSPVMKCIGLVAILPFVATSAAGVVKTTEDGEVQKIDRRDSQWWRVRQPKVFTFTPESKSTNKGWLGKQKSKGVKSGETFPWSEKSRGAGSPQPLSNPFPRADSEQDQYVDNTWPFAYAYTRPGSLPRFTGNPFPLAPSPRLQPSSNPFSEGGSWRSQPFGKTYPKPASQPQYSNNPFPLAGSVQQNPRNGYQPQQPASWPGQNAQQGAPLAWPGVGQAAQPNDPRAGQYKGNPWATQLPGAELYQGWGPGGLPLVLPSPKPPPKPSPKPSPATAQPEFSISRSSPASVFTSVTPIFQPPLKASKEPSASAPVFTSVTVAAQPPVEAAKGTAEAAKSSELQPEASPEFVYPEAIVPYSLPSHSAAPVKEPAAPVKEPAAPVKEPAAVPTTSGPKAVPSPGSEPRIANQGVSNPAPPAAQQTAVWSKKPLPLAWHGNNAPEGGTTQYEWIEGIGYVPAGSMGPRRLGAKRLARRYLTSGYTPKKLQSEKKPVPFESAKGHWRPTIQRIPNANLVEEKSLQKRGDDLPCTDLTVIFAGGSITKAHPDMFTILASVMGKENLTMQGLTVPGEESVSATRNI